MWQTEGTIMLYALVMFFPRKVLMLSYFSHQLPHTTFRSFPLLQGRRQHVKSGGAEMFSTQASYGYLIQSNYVDRYTT
jgi:hypothetical protein